MCDVHMHYTLNTVCMFPQVLFKNHKRVMFVKNKTYKQD